MFVILFVKQEIYEESVINNEEAKGSGKKMKKDQHIEWKMTTNRQQAYNENSSRKKSLKYFHK